jgi:uncharacterized protein (DUF1778 family)
MTAKRVRKRVAKEEMLRIRVTVEQKAALEAAAKRRGLGVSGYVRMAALDLARAEGIEA